jgi:hypothetical protein
MSFSTITVDAAGYWLSAQARRRKLIDPQIGE